MDSAPGGSVLSKDDTERLRVEFQSIDINKDGMISKEELHLLWRKVFPHLDEDEAIGMAEEVLALADLDGDGKVDFDEFLSLCTMDNSLRFDVCFVRYQRRKANDLLGLSFYLPFLALFVYFLVEGKAIGDGYWFSSAISNGAGGYGNVGTPDDFWVWAKGDLVNAFWTSSSATSNARGHVFGQSLAIGALKLRQVRVEPETCPESHTDLLNHKKTDYSAAYVLERQSEFFPKCYPTLGSGSREESDYPYIPTAVKTKDSPWVYRTCSELNGTSIYTGKTHRYLCQGYAEILPFDATRVVVLSKLETLQKGVQGFNGTATVNIPWVDDQTRAIFAEFILFNQNIRIMARAQFLFEFTAGGAVVPTRQITLFNLHQWSDHGGGYWFFLFVFFVFILTYIISYFIDVRERTKTLMRDKHWRGFRKGCKAIIKVLVGEPWLVFDLVNLSIFMASWILRFTWMGIGLTDTSILETGYFPDGYEAVADLFHSMSILDAMNALLCFIRIFYYLRLNAQLNLLTKTVDKALAELIGIVFIFVIVFVAFALMALVAFAHVSEDFKDFTSTVSTLSRILVGDMDYVGLREERRVFAGIFFVLFIIMAIFLLLNMVIAVLSAAFDEVQEEKYDFGPIETIMDSVNAPEFRPQSTVRWVASLPFFVECRYWATWVTLHAMRTVGKFSDEEYALAVRDAEDRCPRKYWAHLEEELLERRVVIDFRSKLKLTPIALQEKLQETFGSDLVALREGLVLPTVEKAKISERQLVLDLVEFHHYWVASAEDFADIQDEDDGDGKDEVAQHDTADELTANHSVMNLQRKNTARNLKGAPCAGTGGGDGRVDEVIRRLDKMKSSRREVIEVMKMEVCDAVEKKMMYVVNEQLRTVLQEVLSGVQGEPISHPLNLAASPSQSALRRNTAGTVSDSRPASPQRAHLVEEQMKEDSDSNEKR